MGLAGAAMLGAIVSFFMSISTGVKILTWRKRGKPGKGSIKSLKNTECVYKDKKQTTISYRKYIYALEITCDGQTFESEYTENITPSKNSVPLGTEIDLYWDTASNQYFDYAKGKKELWQYPLICILCVAVFFICILISHLLTE